MEEDVLMPIDVPNNPKVYTTKYENFRGVDFTNDQTNVWYRRSPTGLNMLPDASGRPFKRHGWEILLSQEEICDIFSVNECSITRVSYFELAGEDHLVIWTDKGVAFYNGEVTAYSTDAELYGNYDRAFFFEGGGQAAFYIYGSYRIWKYDDTFTLRDVTSEAKIPTILFSASADGTGTAYDAYNLVGQRAAVEYHDVTLFSFWTTDNIYASLTDENALKTAMTTAGKSYIEWVYNGSSWNTPSSLVHTNYFSVSGTPKDGDYIIVLYGNGVIIPNSVSQSQVANGEVEVYATTTMQYDTPLSVVGEGTTPTTGECEVCTDPTGKHSWIIFGDAWANTSEEDIIKVIFPTALIEQTTISNSYITETTASFDGEAIT